MSWDFETDPDFEAKLEWMRHFVREEVWPLEVAEVDEASFARLLTPLQDQVRAQGL